MIEFKIQTKNVMFFDVNHDEFMSMKKVNVYGDRDDFISTEINCFMLNNGLTKEDIEEHAHKENHLGFEVYKYKGKLILIIDWPLLIRGIAARVINLDAECNCGYTGTFDDLKPKEDTE